MTPVISPWVFYLISVADSLITLAIVVACISFAWALFYLTDMKKPPVLAVVLTVLSVLTSFLTPSSDTITKMIIAQNVTYERVEVAADTVQSVYEDIMSLFEEGD